MFQNDYIFLSTMLIKNVRHDLRNMTTKDGTCLFIVWECIVQSFFLLLQNFFFLFFDTSVVAVTWNLISRWCEQRTSFSLRSLKPQSEMTCHLFVPVSRENGKGHEKFWYCQKILVFFSMLDFSASESSFYRISYTSEARPFLVTFTHCETLFLWIWSFGRGPFWSVKCAFKPQFTV